jgi:HAD superfamily hydrolase (TIGR01490 family)
VTAAIVDLDGTLYTGHIHIGVMLHHRTHRVNRLPLVVFMATHMAMWPLVRAGRMSRATFHAVWARHMGWTVWRLPEERAAAAFAWIARRYVQPLVREEMLARVREHQSQGHRVVLVSGTMAPLLAEIGRQLGIEDTVGTPLVVRNGRYTGGHLPPVCQGIGKVQRLEACLGADAVDWAASFAYADSYTDLPLLERVGHPVAVYPDEELAAHARHAGWALLPAEE